ncbi:hypothetical protein PN498_18245 [Oscillatoria sp. CS-180]|uniref:hypothetical protein n=1 Tax=Oscillatoria sp. CS-180 TaxID=3021720 RepID=UPI00232E910B|nr:hypothetical protein [Oscillatoria sp. CS-180]MDB9527940.1 hypothetical protein [Oscillatoria sp. CS-180]
MSDVDAERALIEKEAAEQSTPRDDDPDCPSRWMTMRKSDEAATHACPFGGWLKYQYGSAP